MTARRIVRWGLVAGAAGVLWRRGQTPPAELTGKVVMITGASGGLGLALARDLAAEGCTLVLCARDSGALASAADELRDQGATVFAQACDVSDRDAVQQLVHDATEQLGSVYALVNNAGVIDVGEVGPADHGAFERMMDVVFWGVVNATLAVLPVMRSQGRGRILTVTSIGGRVSPPHLVPYASAKHAAYAFTQGMRAELAADGIAVTTVVPGLMRTGSHRAVTVKGGDRREFAWFALGGASAITSTDSAKASRKIVEALRAGRAVVTIGFDAWLATRLEGLFPGLVNNVLSVLARVLPETDSNQRREGMELESALTRSPATAPGRRAAGDLQQHRGPVAEP